MDEKSDGEKGAEKRLMLMALINQYMMGDVDKYPALGVCSRLLPKGPQWDEFQSPYFKIGISGSSGKNEIQWSGKFMKGSPKYIKGT